MGGDAVIRRSLGMVMAQWWESPRVAKETGRLVVTRMEAYEGEKRAEQARERDAAAAAKDQQATKQMGEAVKKALQRNRVQQGDQGGEAAPVKSAAEEQLDAMTKALSESEQADAAAAREKMDAATRSAKEAEAAAGAAAKSLIDDATHSAQQVADASRHREQQAAAHTRTRTRTRTRT